MKFLFDYLDERFDKFNVFLVAICTIFLLFFNTGILPNTLVEKLFVNFSLEVPIRIDDFEDVYMTFVRSFTFNFLHINLFHFVSNITMILFAAYWIKKYLVTENFSKKEITRMFLDIFMIMLCVVLIFVNLDFYYVMHKTIAYHLIGISGYVSALLTVFLWFFVCNIRSFFFDMFRNGISNFGKSLFLLFLCSYIFLEITANFVLYYFLVFPGTGIQVYEISFATHIGGYTTGMLFLIYYYFYIKPMYGRKQKNSSS